MSNKEAQRAELRALRAEHRGTDDFDFLGPKVRDATADNPTSMRIARMAGPGGDIALVITVTLPENYPSDAPPVFLVEAGGMSSWLGRGFRVIVLPSLRV